MKIFLIILAGIVILVLSSLLSFGLGHTFRKWNEGDNFIDGGKDSTDNLKTFAIGIVIFGLIMFLLSKCEGFGESY